MVRSSRTFETMLSRKHHQQRHLTTDGSNHSNSTNTNYFYWYRPLGCSDNVRRLMIVGDSKRTNRTSSLTPNGCWAIKISTIERLIDEIQSYFDTTTQNNSITLEIDLRYLDANNDNDVISRSFIANEWTLLCNAFRSGRSSSTDSNCNNITSIRWFSPARNIFGRYAGILLTSIRNTIQHLELKIHTCQSTLDGRCNNTNHRGSAIKSSSSFYQPIFDALQNNHTNYKHDYFGNFHSLSIMNDTITTRINDNQKNSVLSSSLSPVSWSS